MIRARLFVAAMISLATVGLVDTAGAQAQAIGPRLEGLCHHHVGGVTVPSFTQGHNVQCTLFGPGTFTVEPGATSKIGTLILADHLKFLSEGSGYQFEGGVTLQGTTVFENAGTFGVGGSYGFRGDPTALVRNDVGATMNAARGTAIDVPMINNGTVSATNTGISLPYLRNFDNGVLTGGTYQADGGGRLRLPGPVLTNKSTVIEGPDSTVLTTENHTALDHLALNTGTLEIDVPQPVGALTNRGTVRLGAPGHLTASGPVTLGASSSLQTSVTTGAQGPDYGRIETDSTASVGGTLTVSTDPLAYPVPGSTYTVVSAAGGLTGHFGAVDGLDLPDGDHYDVVYTDTAVQLVVVSGQQIPLAVSSAEPNAVGQGARAYAITIRGTGFAPGAMVGFGDSSVLATDVSVVDNTEITAKLNVGSHAAIGARDVKVRMPGQGVAACPGCLTVDAGPVVSAVSGPAAVGAHAPLVLSGTGFTGRMTAVTSGPSTGVTATISDVSGTGATMHVVVPPGSALGTYSIRVRNWDGGMGSCTSCLTVVAAPTLTSIAPTTVGRGKTVTLSVTGSGFTADATFSGPSGVSFGAVDVTDPEHLTVPITVSGSTVPGPNQTITLTNGPSGGYGTASLASLTIT